MDKDKYDHDHGFGAAAQRGLIGYTPVNVPGRGCDEDLFNGLLTVGCRDSRCEDCECAKKFPGFECNSRCECAGNPGRCANRRVQSGPVGGLAVVTKGDKGLGLTCVNDLKRGEFVCEYAGEIIGEKEAQKRFCGQKNAKKMNYILFVNEMNEEGRLLSRTVVDPTAVGNVGRYLNHSCEPNLTMNVVRSETSVPHLALFANRDIPANEELCFDYYGRGNDVDRVVANRGTKCLCGANSCRGFLPFQPDLCPAE